MGRALITAYRKERFYEPLLKQSSYQQNLRLSLDEIKKQAERLKEEAIQCSHQRLRDMDRGLLRYGDLQQDLLHETSENRDLLQKIYQEMSQMRHVYQALLRTLQYQGNLPTDAHI
jgi:uncharacterized protein YktB (UPF0637 family)